MRKVVSQQVIRCAFEVSNYLGAGFLEKVYENALCAEIHRNGLAVSQQKSIKVKYKGLQVG